MLCSNIISAAFLVEALGPMVTSGAGVIISQIMTFLGSTPRAKTCSNMPQVVQWLTFLNPVRFYMIIVRGIMMKGAGIMVLYPEIIAIIIFGLAIFTMSWLRFSKRVK